SHLVRIVNAVTDGFEARIACEIFNDQLASEIPEVGIAGERFEGTVRMEEFQGAGDGERVEVNHHGFFARLAADVCDGRLEESAVAGLDRVLRWGAEWQGPELSGDEPGRGGSLKDQAVGAVRVQRRNNSGTDGWAKIEILRPIGGKEIGFEVDHRERLE